MTDTEKLVEELRELLAKATPGPYRAHDHNSMASVGEDPEKWMGYAWVGRLTKDSTPDGRWDAGWLDLDRRKDGHKEYRERASADAHFVATTLNALPSLLDALTAAQHEIARLRDLCDQLRTEAQIHSGEARAHKATVHEAYQAVTGASGEPGNWHGAEPIRAEIARLREALDNLPDEIEIYRIIKRSGARKHGEIANAVAKALEPSGETR